MCGGMLYKIVKRFYGLMATLGSCGALSLFRGDFREASAKRYE